VVLPLFLDLCTVKGFYIFRQYKLYIRRILVYENLTVKMRKTSVEKIATDIFIFGKVFQTASKTSTQEQRKQEEALLSLHQSSLLG
jgi:hypothetical protein